MIGDGVRSGFFVEPCGKRGFDEISGKLLKRFNLSEIFRLKQVHGAEILINSSGEADGIIVTGEGCCGTVLTADCFPVALYDPDRPVAGLFHCGWRGLVKGILEKGIDLLYQNGAVNLRAAIYPGIGSCCFEITSELFETFNKASVPIEDRFGKYFADLKVVVEGRLRARNIPFDDFWRCTACGGLYSYRRTKDTRRHLTFVCNP